MKNNSDPLVSIILPVHNAGIGLLRCLETLINQTLKEIEIICVVDAPTDDSDIVVEEYARRDTRIKVITNEKNLHISQSRNRGLEVATGEYIGFSDHDDWRENTMYESLYRIAKTDNADIVISNSYVIRDNQTTLYKYYETSKYGVISSLILPMWHKLNQNYLSKSVWASIYNREFIQANNIQFPERTIFYQEDTLFNLRAFLNANKISFAGEAFYYWNINENSTSDVYITDYAERQINFFEAIISELRKFELVEKYKNELTIVITNLFIVHFDSYKNLSAVFKTRLSGLLKYILFRFQYNKLFSHLPFLKRVQIKAYITRLYLFRINAHLTK